MAKRLKKESNKTTYKIIVVLIFLIGIIMVLQYSGNYVVDEITDKANLIINNGNVTKSLKLDMFIDENETVYISKQDIENFFDPYIYYDEKYNQIITGSNTKIASIVVGSNEMYVNSSKVNISAPIIEKEGEYYIPFSELDDVYNVDTQYIAENNVVVIDSLNRKYSIATSGKDNSVKYKPTGLSKTIDKIEKGEIVTIANREDEESKDGWTRVRTDSGKIGYVKTKDLGTENVIREAFEETKKFEGTVSMVWDYFSESYYAPDRSGTKIKGVNVVSPAFFSLEKLGKGEVYVNIDEPGKEYIEWAHNNGYEVWPMISNGSMIETTSEIMQDYKLRESLINKIVSYIVQYNLDGINIDFENMYEEDKDYFSRFIIELEPRLNEIGAVLSVDVTAPDGGSTWSMCYDRYTIGQVADYIAFMAYDQHNSTTEGTTAGYDWVEANINKFLGQEGVSAEKIILGIPFYTLLWVEGETPYTVNINKVDEVLPNNIEKEWDEDLKQYYVEYEEDGLIHKMWIEDENSIGEKLNLVEKYKLAGAAYWTKDRESEEVLDVISEKLQID